ncbi:MAG: histidine kinase, partial [Marinilabiliales bacterium]|nr:histidine kinase [Marinilabiliales bacterium]
MVAGDHFEQMKDIYCMTTFYDPQTDLLWVGTKGQAIVYDQNRKKVQVIQERQGLNVGNNVLTIGKDAQGYFWLGGGKQVARYDPRRDHLRNYSLSGHLSGCYAQCTDYKGTTWFGSRGGLFWYDAKSDSILQLKREELSDDVVAVASIDSTWLVVSQPYGIYLMDLKKYYRSGETDLHLYNEKNGFTGVEPNQDGMYLDSNNELWITTSTELVRFTPQKLNVSQNSLSVRIAKCNGERIPFGASQVRLPRNQNSTVLTFDAIAFNRPNPVQYAWKKSTDSIWSPWQEENYAIISQLKDGKTGIEVRARIVGLPLGNLAGTRMDVLVSMALYRQAWFFPTLLSIVTLLVIVTLVLLIKTFSSMVRIGKQAKMFQLQAILSQLNPHFIFNVLAALQSVILSANLQKANEYLVKMSGLIRGFLDASISAGFSRTKNIRETELPLSKELEILDHFIQFQQLIYPDRFTYELIMDSAISPEKLTVPPMLIQPFVENSIKHGLLQKGNMGKLTVHIYLDEKRTLVVDIADDGIGIEKAEALMRQSHLLYT